MELREDLHKGRQRRLSTLLAFAVLSLAGSSCSNADAGPPSPDSPELPQVSARGEAAAGAAPATEVASEGYREPARRYPPVGYAWVIFGADTVVAEVAATPDERAEGLMYRDDVPDGTGMLFVFEDNRPRAFWMANTYVPLDIAYLDPSYRVVDIIAMEPLVTESYPSRAPAMFALEVRQGWFAENGIGVGSQASIVFGVAGR